MQQHALDDGVSAPAVLHDLFEIATQQISQFHDLGACFRISRYTAQSILQLTDQFSRQGRKIVDEIERVLDFMRNSRGQLTERGKLLRLYKPILGDPKFG